MSTSTKALLAAFVVCCILAESYGISCFWTDPDGKEQKVNCTSVSKFCVKASETLAGKEFKNVKGCAGNSTYAPSLGGSFGALLVNCTKDGDVNGNGMSSSCCSDKDYCNSAGRSGIALGLLSVVVTSPMTKPVLLGEL
ncbi:hypothetical protein AAVH_08088 [Aphelenchoides avenae]|nr:hypothetical protein AAVH_08088 [Aphelenchus avenae]